MAIESVALQKNTETGEVECPQCGKGDSFWQKVPVRLEIAKEADERSVTPGSVAGVFNGEPLLECGACGWTGIPMA